VPRLPSLLLRRAERGGPPAGRPGAIRVPRPRAGLDGARPRPVIRRGPEALALLDVAPPPPRLQAGSLLVGFAVGAVVAARRPGVVRRP
jgi:hypothetical protein